MVEEMKPLSHGLRVLVVMIWACVSAGPIMAQELAAGPAIGPETNLPLPRFVFAAGHRGERTPRAIPVASDRLGLQAP